MKFLFCAIIVCSTIVFSTHTMGPETISPIESGISGHKICKQPADTTIKNTIVSGAKIAMGACSLLILAKVRVPKNYPIRWACDGYRTACVNNKLAIARPTTGEKFWLATPAILAIWSGCHDFYTRSIQSQCMEKSPTNN